MSGSTSSGVPLRQAPVRALVLHADGIVQDNPVGWLEDVTAVAARSNRQRLADDLFGTEVAAMTGRRPFADALDEACGRWGVQEHRPELRLPWRRIGVPPDMVELVQDLRGPGCPATSRRTRTTSGRRTSASWCPAHGTGALRDLLTHHGIGPHRPS